MSLPVRSRTRRIPTPRLGQLQPDMQSSEPLSIMGGSFRVRDCWVIEHLRLPSDGPQ